MTKRNAKNAAPVIELSAIEVGTDIMTLGDDIAALIPEAPVVEEASTAEIDAELAKIEAYEEQPEAPVHEGEAPNEDQAANELEEVPALVDVLADVSREDAEGMQKRVIASLDARGAHELLKNPDNTNIHKTIAKARNKLAVSLDPSRVLFAAAVDPEFMNRELSDGNRYNVYAIDKVQDFLNFLGGAKGELSNAINIACTRSLFAFHKAGKPFTLETAKGAASKDYARSLDSAVKTLLISHTVARSTASTQSSSTMQALVTLGVVTTSGSRKNPTYTIANTPLTKALEERYAA